MFQKFTGREYLKIDIANSYGLSKLSWDERIRWFDAQNKQDLILLIPTAKEPALFYAGIKAYEDVLAGCPTGYMISLDATSSGLQLLAALTGDRLAAQLCNVVDTGKREDAYQNIYRVMLHTTQETARIKPDDVKQAIMTAFYSSKAVPKRVFGEGTPLLEVFYNTMQTMAPGAWELNEAFLAFWNPTAFEHAWTLPDNFHVHVKVMSQVKERAKFQGQDFDIFYNVNMPMAEGRSLGANVIHSIDGMIVRELTRRCSYNPAQIEAVRQMVATGLGGVSTQSVDDQMVAALWNHYQKSGYLSARILQHLRPGNIGITDIRDIRDLLDSLPEKPFTVVSIHDCFRCLPHYGNDLREQYKLQLKLIAQSNMLKAIVAELFNQPVSSVPVNKLDPLLYKDIEHTNYALS
jgi:hypothetical protein